MLEILIKEINQWKWIGFFRVNTVAEINIFTITHKVHYCVHWSMKLGLQRRLSRSFKSAAQRKNWKPALICEKYKPRLLSQFYFLTYLYFLKFTNWKHFFRNWNEQLIKETRYHYSRQFLFILGIYINILVSEIEAQQWGINQNTSLFNVIIFKSSIKKIIVSIKLLFIHIYQEKNVFKYTTLS